MSTTQERSNNPRGRQGNRGGQQRSNRNNRNRNRNRNRRDGSSENNGGQRSRRNSGSGRSSSSRRRATPEPSLGRKILSIVTFGLVSASPVPARKKRPTASKRSAPEAKKPTRSDKSSKPESQSANRKPKPRRTMELHEVTSGRLYVGNLSYDATESDLEELFAGIGQVQSAEVVSHKRTMRSKGYAFVEMLTLDQAKRAVEVLHNQDFMGRPLIVSGAKTDSRQTQSSKEDSSPEEESAA